MQKIKNEYFLLKIQNCVYTCGLFAVHPNIL